MTQKVNTQIKRSTKLSDWDYDSRQIYPVTDVTDHESMLMHLEQSEFRLRRLVAPFKRVRR